MGVRGVAAGGWGVLAWCGRRLAAAVRAAWRVHTARRQARRLLGVTRAAAGATTASRCAVFFSPRGGCTAALVEAISQARVSVRVLAYSFTSAPIADALAAAARRGVDVRLVIDGEQKGQKSCKGGLCRAAGCEVTWDDKHLIAHNKVVILDGHAVVTGSFNFSAAAETGNAENLLIVQDPDLAAAYTRNWDAHRGHSAP
jgi:phosphatidylserine/phosphatidylglycerophosphate/cardiolipin synthase-like enzyme